MREVVGLSLEKDTSMHEHAQELLSVLLVYALFLCFLCIGKTTDWLSGTARSSGPL